jgi:hypothetical protein
MALLHAADHRLGMKNFLDLGQGDAMLRGQFVDNIRYPDDSFDAQPATSRFAVLFYHLQYPIDHCAKVLPPLLSAGQQYARRPRNYIRYKHSPTSECDRSFLFWL